ncbi:MAG: DUF882 domain-containing protein [Loktanella sp.]|nr:DUF882 domain-containing protein [Loktanella sp.]
MRGTVKFSRRTVVSGLFCIPISVSAAPLVDLEKGGGLFSHKPVSSEQGDERDMAQLYTQQAPAVPVEREEPRPRIATDRPSFAFVMRLQNANTGEGLSLDVPASLELGWIQRRRFNHFMRDWREDQVKRIDPSVVQDFLEICRAFTTPGNPSDVRINSGYRSQRTNEMLRQRSRNVAINSLHVEGRAIDFTLPGVSQRQLGAVANDICRGGVGTYNTFVHIDSGSNRRWSA